MKTFALVAGEQSGDNLAEGLIIELKTLYPDARFIGVGGKKMQQAGLESLADMELLSVMGFIEPIPRIPKLLALRKQIINTCIEQKVDAFIGIDAPAFNTGLEKRLKQKGITTIHYVCPSVWAWREKRIFSIKKAVDLMLTLFPFEAEFCQQHGIKAHCVGHPLAEKFPHQPNKEQALTTLGLSENKQQPLIALMPGSRASEVGQLLPDFIQAALYIRSKINARFILPIANEKVASLIQSTLLEHLDDSNRQWLEVTREPASVAMSAADCCLMASGTVTLEGLFCKVPMVAAYRFNAITYQIAKRLVKTEFVTLPNILAKKEWVPEFIQHFTPEQLGEAVIERVENQELRDAIQSAFEQLHQAVDLGGDKMAANVIYKHLEG